jgi:cytochrome c peroxidase
MKLHKIFLVFFAMALIIVACKKDDGPVDTLIVKDETPYTLEYGNFPPPDLPSDNALTEQGVLLGKMLFYDKKLSEGEKQACADCHSQTDGFSDTLKFSIGVDELPGKRQAMPIFNMAWHTNQFFWDGRANLLRDQSLLPIQDELEMNETLEDVIAKLSAEQMYRDQFTRAFGTAEITSEKMSLAMEQFMLSIISNDAKYDKFLAGNVQLTESEERGRVLFFQEYNPFFPDDSGADCAHCHGGDNFENDLYMNNGLDTDAEFLDIGRENVTMNSADRAKFKVPTLRNIVVTPPYMHDGRFQTLEEVVNHYNEGIKESSTADQTVLNTKDTGLFLTEQDKEDLVNFLKTLTDETFLNNEEYQSPF